MPDFSAALALLKKPIDDLYGVASGTLKEKIGHLRAAYKIKNLHKKLYDSQRVKTIWNTDRPLSLTSFFYPVSLETPTGSTRLASLDDLPDNHNIIFGTVGQGKSILLRYLLGKEIRSGVRIPVFAELRNIGSESLLQHLCARFCMLLGIAYDYELFCYFAGAGKISFLLDGFDEIDPGNVQRLTQQIEELSYFFEFCRIVVTSRPESECRHLTKFSSQRIRPLAHYDLLPFYKKITKDSEFTERLIGAIAASPLKIKELVTTPLLATLLAISYRAAHRIPLDFSEFYEELFQILMVRHDASKLGWRRQRKTKLNDREIQQVFEAFCFVSRKKKAVSFDRDVAYELARDSITECLVQADPQYFIEDIKKITCLMLDDGKKISFVHLSVQEFFASRYVKTRPEPVAAKFYKQLADGKWGDWTEEITFLSQIDSHRATKYFLIPDANKTIVDILKYHSTFGEQCLDNYLEGMNVVRTMVARDGREEPSYTAKRLRYVHTYHYRQLDSIAFDILFSRPYQNAKSWQSGFNENPDSSARTYLQIANDRGPQVMKVLRDSLTKTVNQLVSDCAKWKSNVSHAEVPRSFIDIT